MASYGEPKQDMGLAIAEQFLSLARDAEKQYAEGYRAGRIAALREVGCEYCGGTDTHKVRGGVMCDCMVFPRQGCRRCRLLAEAESGEDTGEVGDDR